MVLKREFMLLYDILIKKHMYIFAIILSILIIVTGNVLYEKFTNNLEDIQTIHLESIPKIEYISDTISKETSIELSRYDNITTSDETIEEIVEVFTDNNIYYYENVGYINVNTELNIRSEPNTESDILSTLYWMDEIHYSIYDDKWYVINLDGEKGYIYSKYITDTKETYTKTYNVSGDKSKTYMDYRKITDKSSKQYALQLRASTNSENGLRMLRNRYMVAIGSYFGCKVGQFIDVELSDGEVLNCIVGDAKQDIHTDANNLHGLSGDTVEFIVETKILKETTPVEGNISDVSEKFDGKVVSIRKYDHVER